MLYRLSGTATSRTSYICINSISNKFKIEQLTIAGEAENNSKILIPNSKIGRHIARYLVFLKVFPLVVFERGDCLSFIWGIYGRENLFS